ncbi:hypothetical protein ACFOOP_15025 [Marinicaulis aureus]|uniref:DUF4345 domain-containing protein n=1 Tax=Hyphococcus aureus TaxID=2666033 RepID=A0ABW1L1J9_9PROT
MNPAMLALMGTTFFLVMITVALAGASLGVTAMLSPRGRALWIYGQLALMAGIYVGFALTGIDPAGIVLRPALSALVVEGLAALLFVLLGLSVLQSGRVWLLGALILAHGGADVAHLLMKADHSPAWYAFLCAIYDAIVGTGAIWFLSGPKKD